MRTATPLSFGVREFPGQRLWQGHTPNPAGVSLFGADTLMGDSGGCPHTIEQVWPGLRWNCRYNLQTRGWLTHRRRHLSSGSLKRRLKFISWRQNCQLIGPDDSSPQPRPFAGPWLEQIAGPYTMEPDDPDDMEDRTPNSGRKQRRPAVKLAVRGVSREQRAARRFSDCPLIVTWRSDESSPLPQPRLPHCLKRDTMRTEVLGNRPKAGVFTSPPPIHRLRRTTPGSANRARSCRPWHSRPAQFRALGQSANPRNRSSL